MEREVHGPKINVNAFVSFACSSYFSSKPGRKKKIMERLSYNTFDKTMIWFIGCWPEKSAENSRIWTNL